MNRRNEYRRIAEQFTHEDLVDDWIVLKEREDELEEKLASSQRLPKTDFSKKSEIVYKWSQNQDCALYFYNCKTHYAVTKESVSGDSLIEGICILMPEQKTEELAFKIQMENQMNDMGDDYENGN